MTGIIVHVIQVRKPSLREVRWTAHRPKEWQHQKIDTKVMCDLPNISCLFSYQSNFNRLQVPRKRVGVMI